jgi:hypothetical protein
MFVLSFFSSPSVLADSDGSLTINTDVLMKNQVQTAGVGDFSIRGELFSNALTALSEKNKSEQHALVHNVKNVDFSVKRKDTSDDNQVKQLLFENYQPQVLTKNSQNVTRKSNGTLLVGLLAVAVFLVLGISAGRWRSRQKSKKQRVRKYDND